MHVELIKIGLGPIICSWEFHEQIISNRCRVSFSVMKTSYQILDIRKIFIVKLRRKQHEQPCYCLQEIFKVRLLKLIVAIMLSYIVGLIPTRAPRRKGAAHIIITTPDGEFHFVQRQSVSSIKLFIVMQRNSKTVLIGLELCGSRA
jgi:hypothetical protein